MTTEFKMPVRYFGYGAMVNPHSRASRKVSPANIRPAVLSNFSLHFTDSGFGTLRRDPGAEVHGLVMDFTSKEEWDIIVKIEAAYDCEEETVRTYDCEDVKAYAFFMDKDVPEGRPQERYLKIIAEGLKHHGVKQEYIDSLFKVDFRPSRKPEHYLTMPVAGDKELPVLTFEEYLERSKTRPCAIIHDKIIDLVGDYDTNNPLIRVFMANHNGKTDMAPRIAATIYDPDRTDDIEVWRWAEDHMMDVIQSMGMQANFQVAARLAPLPDKK